MRIVVAAVSLLLGGSIAAAQSPDSDESILRELEDIRANCKRDLEGQDAFQISGGTMRLAGPQLVLTDNRTDRRIHTKLSGLNRKHRRLRVHCDQLEEWRKRAQLRRVPSNIRVLMRKTRGLSDRVRLDLAAIRRQLAARGIEVPDIVSAGPRRGPRIEFFADLGGSFGLNAPRLDNFGQTLERKPGIYSAGGVALSFPLSTPLGVRTPEPGNNTLFFASAWDVRVGGTVVHSASETTRVLNDTGQFLRTTGHHDTTAALALLGLGVRPFAGDHPLGRFEFTFDGGLGRAFHNVSVFGPGGNQVIRSNDSSLAWMLRGAAIYQVTDYVGIGAFVSHFRTDGVTAFLANGNPFALGGRSETAAGITLVLRAMRASSTYANVHTDQFPGGQIRGQVIFSPTPD